MRITKATLRDVKNGMRNRITELCAILATGGVKKELERCMPGVTVKDGNDPEMLRILLQDMVERAVPEHWVW